MNKNLVIRYVIVAMIVGTVILLAACGGKVTPTTTGQPMDDTPEVVKDGAVVLQERCTQCHGADRVEGKQKTYEQWEETIDRMVQKGTELTAMEKTMLLDYLAETYGP